MNATGLFGGLVAVVGIALCGISMVMIHRLKSSAAAAMEGEDELTQRLRRYSARTLQGRADRLLLAGAAFTMLGLLLMLMNPTTWGAKVTPPAPLPFPPIPAQPTPAATSSVTATTLWPLMAASTAVIAIGAALMAIAKGSAAKIIGAATILSGLAANGYLIGQVKVDDLVKFDIKVDKPGFNVKFTREETSGAEFGPERLALLEGFESGRSVVLGHMRDGLHHICQRWKESGGKTQKGFLLVVGSTDRVRLSSRATQRFESNVGLAQARAEQVKAELMRCGISDSHMLTLVSGPRHTPETTEAGETRERDDFSGNADDRSVAVYALWNRPSAAK